MRKREKEREIGREGGGGGKGGTLSEKKREEAN